MQLPAEISQRHEQRPRAFLDGDKQQVAGGGTLARLKSLGSCLEQPSVRPSGWLVAAAAPEAQTKQVHQWTNTQTNSTASG